MLNAYFQIITHQESHNYFVLKCFLVWGQAEALTRSHMIGSVPFKTKIKQAKETMPLSQKRIATATLARGPVGLLLRS